MKIQFLLISTVSLLTIFSCQQELHPDSSIAPSPNLPEIAYSYPKAVPNSVINRGSILQSSRMNPAYNVISDAGASLGRVLFYDKKLSYNNSVSCASCHQQKFAFADNHSSSVGFDGELTSRNSSSISNAAFQTSYFWDGRETRLEDMVLKPINNHIEMGIDKIENLEAKLAAFDYYPDLFEKAFGSQQITKDKISKALAQFLRSMIGFDSNMDLNKLNAVELAGKNIFESKAQCTFCHGGINLRGYEEDYNNSFSISAFKNIGLDMNYSDKGRGRFQSDLDGYFKTPSLRNVALTAPYMHDGRFNTLEEVVEHYNSGVKANPQLSLEMTEGWDPSSKPRQLNLTDSEKKALVAYLKTFTDNNLIVDKRFSDPFIH